MRGANLFKVKNGRLIPFAIEGSSVCILEKWTISPFYLLSNQF